LFCNEGELIDGDVADVSDVTDSFIAVALPAHFFE
jgi:hypothetical protein